MVVVPFLGWFSIFGYAARLINEFIEDRYEGLPKLHFMEDLKLGFVLFLKGLPFYIVYFSILFAAESVDKTAGILVNLLLGVFVMPVLVVNFLRKQTVISFFELEVLNTVTENLGDYITAVLKQYALVLVFLVLSFVLVGIPAMYFTNSIFIANFYGRFVELKAAP